MMQQITLKINGQDKTFQRTVTARTCRVTYEARRKYVEGVTANKGMLTDALMDSLVGWLVETFGGQFTAQEYWDGYEGNFLEIVLMQQEILDAVAGAVIEYPKPKPGADK